MTASAAPGVTPLTEPFWSGVSQGVLKVQRCEACGRLRFYPSESCPHCSSAQSRWIKLSGRGTIYSWTVVHRSLDAEWQARTPYCVAIVEISEQAGVLIPGLMHDFEPARISAGMEVVVAFPRAGDGAPQFGWKPAG